MTMSLALLLVTAALAVVVLASPTLARVLRGRVAPEAVANTTFGAVAGVVHAKYREWQGVPFATPPLGKLRFRNPVPPGRWDDVLDCRNFTIACAQRAHSLDVPWNKSEDCLYAEVFAPRAGAYGGAAAAVMLFFYGGDFKEGGESFAIYNGRHFASTSNTVVIVPNYRVSVLGFLYTGATDGNVGLADQAFALEWAAANAPAFGGDPKRITIFGQSAGAQSVFIHLTAPEAPSARHIAGAIAHSGPLPLLFKNIDEALVLAEIFAYRLGCDLADVPCMQRAALDDVLDAGAHAISVPLSIGQAVQRWAPTIDPSAPLGLMHEEPLAAFAAGRSLPVPLIAGSTLDDGVLFGYAIAGKNKTLGGAEYAGIVALMFHDDNVPGVLERYPVVWLGDNRDVLSRLITDYLFLCPNRWAARRHAAAHAKRDVGAFLYRFVRVPPEQYCFWPPSQKYCCDRCCHGAELPWVFVDSGPPFPWNITEPDLSVAKAMNAAWASFAASGKPGGTWADAAATNLTAVFNTTVSNVKLLMDERCTYFDQVGYWH